MNLPTPKRIDMSQFILAKQGEQLTLSQIPTAVAQTELPATISDTFLALLTDGISEIKITNQGTMPSNQGLFVLKITKNELQLIERKSIQKTDSTFSFKSRTLSQNGQQVGNSFMENFLNKLDQINTLINQNKVKVDIQ